MKIRKFAAALLALVLCLSLSLPAAFAEAQQRVELKNLTVNVKCTGNAIPDEQLTIRLTEAGWEKARVEQAARIRFRERAFSALTHDEREQLAEMLEKIRKTWEELDD